MAKEMMIVFIYDTIKNDEFHDPVKSVIYFHPSWVSETQKLLLCGQLMGTAHFLGETLFKPTMISLQSGKFAIKSFGRFLLAVGSDRNISETVLEHRANFLYTLIKMYHCDVNAIYEQFSTSEQQTKFADKMYSIMESYLPLLQYNGNIFQNVSSLKIPKSASNLYLETTQILQSFQQTKGVLGGTILYHNKVVASQLSDNLTKIFTLSDLYRLKSSEYITANYHIPIGVTLINAYIPANEYADLLRSSTQSYNLFVNSAAKDIIPFQMRKKSFSKDSHSLMKRDKSLIFTHIPEEGPDDASGSMKLSFQKKRPTHLPLLFKNPTSMDRTESGFNSINFDETDSFPNFIGKTSVCSTPMAENKLLPHGNVLSICAASEDIDIGEQPQAPTTTDDRENLPTKEDAETVVEAENKQPNGAIKNTFTNFISNPHKTSHMRASLTDLNKATSPSENDDNSTHLEAGSKDMPIPKLKNLKNRNFCKTIADPTYPIFNSDGHVVSYSLFKEFLELHYNDLKNFTPQSSNNYSTVQKPEEAHSTTTSELSNTQPNAAAHNIQANKKSRRDLNLPLKALNLDKDPEVAASQQGNIFDSPVRRKKLSGLQLTPLMSKLTILAMNDQQSSGFSSWDTTPGCSFNNPMTPLDYQPKRRKSKTFPAAIATGEDESSSENESSNNPVKVELFICVQQNMTLVLILQEKSCEKEDMIHSLFETCVSKLTRIEGSLHQVMSINVEGSDKGDGGYSFICLDSKWDVNNRCGPWTPRDLLTLNSLHNSFHYNRKLIEFILKSQDAVVYSYRCGRSEIYYQQSSITLSGLPPPQDAMGTVSLCAKRRLERDHRILLL